MAYFSRLGDSPIGKFVNLAKIPLFVALLGVMLFIFEALPFQFVDWHFVYRGAASNWLEPYADSDAFNPPWTYLILAPFVLLPPRFDAALWLLISLAIIFKYLYAEDDSNGFENIARFGAVACSAPLIGLLNSAQIDALVILGLMLPHGLGLGLMIIKPQESLFAMLPRLNRWSVLVLAWLLAFSFAMWGWWPGDLLDGRRVVQRHNLSLYPYSLIAVAPLLYYGLKNKSDALLCASSLCLSPYFMIHSLLPATAAAVKETRWYWWPVIVLGEWLFLFWMVYP